MKLSDMYIFHSYSPGLRVLDYTKDPAFIQLLEMQKNDTLRLEFPSKERVNRKASNFHSADMLLSNVSKNIVKKELIDLEIPLKDEDGEFNEKGTYVTEDVNVILFLMNSLVGTGDKRIGLDKMGKQLTEKQKELLVEPGANIKDSMTLDRAKLKNKR